MFLAAKIEIAAKTLQADAEENSQIQYECHL